MTRINVVPVEELSDAWLIAEYRELPRVLKGNFSIKDAPNRYKLGTGHVKWARKHALFVLDRYRSLVEEMKYRGFKVNYTDDLKRYLTKDISNCYTICNEDIKVNRERLVERYKSNINFHRWTKRKKPEYLA